MYYAKRIGGDISWDANLKFENELSTKIQIICQIFVSFEIKFLFVLATDVLNFNMSFFIF
jgi:hypothetical protein